VSHAAAPPVPAGGSIADGVWRATVIHNWAPTAVGAGGKGGGLVFRFSSGAFELVLGDTSAEDERSTGTFVVKGSSLELRATCTHPDADAGAQPRYLDFTVESATRLHVFVGYVPATSAVEYVLERL
jgi:hypothetical protein